MRIRNTLQLTSQSHHPPKDSPSAPYSHFAQLKAPPAPAPAPCHHRAHAVQPRCATLRALDFETPASASEHNTHPHHHPHHLGIPQIHSPHRRSEGSKRSLAFQRCALFVAATATARSPRARLRLLFRHRHRCQSERLAIGRRWVCLSRAAGRRNRLVELRRTLCLRRVLALRNLSSLSWFLMTRQSCSCDSLS